VDETEIISELYALPLADFTRVRNDLAAQAKRRGRKQLAESIKQLRKPTASAWAVNLLVRHHPEEITALLEIGAQLREAQSSLAGDTLRELTRQRRQAIAALGRRARAVAAQYGQKLSAASESEVEETLQAALVDPAAGYALRSGRLTAPLSYVGLGPLSAVAGPAPTAETEIPKPAGTSITATWPEGDGGLIWPVPDEIEPPRVPAPAPPVAVPAPAAPKPVPKSVPTSVPTSVPKPAAEPARDRRAEEERRRRERDELEQLRRRRELAEARESQEEAEVRAARTAAELDEAQARAEAATARRVELDRRVDALHEELREAEEAAMRAAKDVLEARHARDSAARADLVARRAVERSRAEVERLEG
jgi:hypothetical protein